MEDVLALLIKIACYGAILYALPIVVAKTFLNKQVDGRALGIVMAVLVGLAALSITHELIGLLTQPLNDSGNRVERLDTPIRTGPFELNIR